MYDLPLIKDVTCVSDLSLSCLGVSTQSSASDADYSIPPDAVRSQSHDGNSSDEPEPKAKLLKTCSLDKASKSSLDSIDKTDKVFFHV